MTSPAIRIHANDNVVIARRQLLGGTVLPEEGITVQGLVPPATRSPRVPSQPERPCAATTS
jgi:hypothetical protein